MVLSVREQGWGPPSCREITQMQINPFRENCREKGKCLTVKQVHKTWMLDRKTWGTRVARFVSVSKL